MTSFNKYSKTLNFPMFHGTDARILRMTDAERTEMVKKCQMVIDYYWRFFKDGYQQFEYKLDRITYLNFIDSWNLYSQSLLGNGQFQYGNIYLTNCPGMALNYAKRCFVHGEIGLIAYRFWDTATKLNFDIVDMPDSVKDAIEAIKYAEACPDEFVVCMFNNLEKALIYRDDGTKIDWRKEEVPIGNLDINCAFRYLGTLDFNNCRRLDLRDYGNELMNLGFEIIDIGNGRFISIKI